MQPYYGLKRKGNRASPAYHRWLLLGSGVVPVGHATKPATRAPSRALPRRRALCTNWHCVACVDGPWSARGECVIWPTERVRSCVRPSTRLHDRWPRWVPPNKPQTWMRHRDALAPNEVSCSPVRPFAISTVCPFAPRRRRTIRRLAACAGKPSRSPSWPTRCGPSCWPERPPPLCAAGAPAIAAARGWRSCCLAWLNTVHFAIRMAALKSIRVIGCGVRGRNG